MGESRLFEDVHAAAEVSKAVARQESASASPRVSAIEEGRREHADGTTVEYRRVEFE